MRGAGEEREERHARTSALGLLCLQLVHPKNIPPSGFRCWKRVFRADGWIGLQPVEISSVSVEPSSGDAGWQSLSPVLCSAESAARFFETRRVCRCVVCRALHAGDGVGGLYKGHAVTRPLVGPTLESFANEAAPEESVALDELFMDAVGDADSTEGKT